MSARGWLVAALLAGCGGGPTAGPPPAADAGAPAGVPDYWHDAKPILDRRCATCHSADNIAPFPLSTYTDVQASALLIQAAVDARTMPPWAPNDCCRTYAPDRSLSADERALLLRWLDAGAPEGDPQGAPPSTPPPPPSLARVDVKVRMHEPYVPVAQADTSEQRCFLLEDWPFTSDKTVTGVEVRPGNRAIVHDATVQTVPEDALPGLRAREGGDGRPGFDCRDLPEALHVDGRLGSWEPGGLPFESSDATPGLPVPAGSQLMLRIHYDVRNGVTESDQTEVDLALADTVTHPARSLVVASPSGLASFELPAGIADVARAFIFDPKAALVLHGVALHMHARGARGRVGILHADGSWDCLLDIPRWNEAWAGATTFAEPQGLRAGDRLYVECHWDTGAAHQPSQEMCAAILLVTDGAR